MFKPQVLLLSCLAAALVACPTPPPTPPVITAFTATPNTLPVGGGTVKLEWQITGEASLSIDGLGAVTGTSKDVNVTASQTFKLTATNAGGQAEKTVNVTVATTTNPPPPPPPSALTSLEGSVSGWTRGERAARFTTNPNQTQVATSSGTIKTDGSFQVALPDETQMQSVVSAINGTPCGTLIFSPSDAKLASATSIDVRNTANTSSIGTLIYATNPPTSGGPVVVGGAFVNWLYVDRALTMTGTCNNGTYDLKLVRGWNAVSIENTTSSTGRITSTLPSNLKWYFNPATTNLRVTAPATKLEIGKPYQFNLLDADDQPVQGQITWTSEPPGVLEISNVGLVTPKRLVPSGTNVVVRATLNGFQFSSAPLAVYGLDARGGTFNTGSGTLGTAVYLKYRDENGTPPTADRTYTLSGPSGWNSGNTLSITYRANQSQTWLTSSVAATSGTYTVSSNGTTITSFTVDATKSIPTVTNLKIGDYNGNYTTSSVSTSWTAPDLPGQSFVTKSFDARIVDTSDSSVIASQQSGWSGTSATFNNLSLNVARTFEARVVMFNTDLTEQYTSFGTPEQFNASLAVQAFDFKPNITRLSFGGGPAAGGVKLTITGRNFVTGATVSLGGTPSTSVSVDNTNQITAVVPARSAGIVDVTVASGAGSSATSSATKFQYFNITEYAVTGTPKLAPGSDGNVWFVENNGSPYSIGKITPGGSITRYPLPTTTSVSDLTLGPDGNVWFAYSGYYSSTEIKIAKVAANGTFTEYTLPSGFGSASMIAAGPDGRIWITSSSASKIARINTDGTGFTDYTLPISGGVSDSGDMRAGPDGNLWFTDVSGTKIGKVTPSGVVSMFTVSSSGCCSSSIGGLTSGPDNSVWVTLGNRLGKVASSGAVTDFPLTDGTYSLSTGNRIAHGSDNNLWFLTGSYYSSSLTLGRMTPSGAVINVILADPGTGCCSYGPSDVIAANGKIWYSRNNVIGVLTP